MPLSTATEAGQCRLTLKLGIILPIGQKGPFMARVIRFPRNTTRPRGSIPSLLRCLERVMRAAELRCGSTKAGRQPPIGDHAPKSVFPSGCPERQGIVGAGHALVMVALSKKTINESDGWRGINQRSAAAH